LSPPATLPVGTTTLRGSTKDVRSIATPNEFITYYCGLGLAKLNARSRSQALTCLTQAHQGLFSVTTPKLLQEQYHSLRALIAVDGAEFLSTAREYFYLGTVVVPEKADYLRLAMVYGILAPASQARDGLFKQLTQDERSRKFLVAVLVEAAEVEPLRRERGFSMEALSQRDAGAQHEGLQSARKPIR
jgi:hypothetical protein